MTDIEERLTAALRGVAGDAPDATGLAGAARVRATARRRRTTLGSGAASVAVLAVVGGALALGARGGEGTPVTGNDTTPTGTPTTAAATRIETWHDASVTVPASWGHGPLSTWCTQGSEPGTPVVERPGGVVESIACSPQNGYGVQFSDGSKFVAAYSPGTIWPYTDGDRHEYAEGAWLGYQVTSRGTLVQIAAPTRAEVEAVLASFQQVEGADGNGCPARLPHAAGPVADGSVRLCRFTEDGWLEQSETLTGASAAEAMAALDAAPTREPRNCPVSADLVMVRVASAKGSADVHWQGCTGVFGWGDVERDLTSDVLYWTLSPGWSGGVDGDVPMPDQLRK